MKTDDRELIYLYRTEALQSAFDILYENYFDRLISATYNYYLNAFNKALNFEINDIKSFCFNNFIKIINEFNLNSNKYNFSQYLFIVNRSYFRDYLIHELNTSGNHVLNVAFSLNETNNQYISEIQHLNDENKLTLNILIKQIIDYVKHYALNILNDKQLSVFNLWINGSDFEKIHKETCIGLNKVINIVRSMAKKINYAIAYKFNLNIKFLPYNFCLKIQGF